MSEDNLNADNFKVLSLNCWGLWYISKHRQQRIKLIAQHLSEQNYDFVFLQEIWCESDFEYIRSTTASKFKFAHLFKTASIIGNSGLVILSKWKPSYIHFEPFAINGTPFRPWHGDWFSGKGVAYIRVQRNGTNFHLFGCHMHAQYNVNEHPDDQYSIHRICQAYQLAKFINLIGHSFTGSTSRDLMILAGDLNTDSNELPYRLLVSMTNLTDSYGQYVNHGICDLSVDTNYRIAAKYFIEDADLITCGHHSNTFTGTDESGKRIDYIMYKLMQQCDENNIDGTTEHFYCLSDRVECHGKDVDAGLSFSDHQPVAIQLKLKTKSKAIESELRTSFVVPPMNGNPNGLQNSKLNVGIGDGLGIGNILLEQPMKEVESDEMNSRNCGENDENKICENQVNGLADSVVKVNTTESVTITRNRIKRNSNVSLEIMENGQKVVGNIPPELKKQAIAIVSKLYPLNKIKIQDKVQTTHRTENLYLRRAHQLIESYLSSNLKSKKRSLLYLAFVMFVLIVILTFVCFYVNVKISEVLLGWMVVVTCGVFVFILMEIIYRFEQNAIAGVFEDINYMLDFFESIQ